MAKWLKYKNFNQYNERISETMLHKAMNDKLYKNIVKENILRNVREDYNKDSELTEYMLDHYAMYFI